MPSLGNLTRDRVQGEMEAVPYYAMKSYKSKDPLE